MERVYEGNPKKTRKVFEKLESTERKGIKREFKKCMNDYMQRLEKYLNSLSKEVRWSSGMSDSEIGIGIYPLCFAFAGNGRVREPIATTCHRAAGREGFCRFRQQF